MDTHLAVVHQAPLALVHELDRVLHRQDVILTVLVAVVHDSRQRGGLAGARGPRHQHHALVQHREFLQHRWQRRVKFLEILERQHLARNRTEHCGHAVLLVEEVRTEAGHAGDLITEVHVARFFVNFDLILRSDLVEHRLQRVALQRRVIHAMELAVDTQHRGVAGCEMQVRGLLLEHEVEEGVNLCHRFLCLLANPMPTGSL